MAATKAKYPPQSTPFVKQLASSNRTVRDRAISSLRTYLAAPRATPIAPLELLKLWKGLFFCMFMTDKPRNQQQLARDLADLVDVLPTQEEKLKFADAFWKIMAKEWANIDYLRTDKYLYLVRCYVGKGFAVLKAAGWDEDVVNIYLDILRSEGGPLSPRDAKVPGGLRLHVLDVWLDELEKVDVEENGPIEKIMGPVRNMAKESLVKSVRDRAKETLEDERLTDGKAWREEANDEGNKVQTRPGDDDEDVEFTGFD